MSSIKSVHRKNVVNETIIYELLTTVNMCTAYYIVTTRQCLMTNPFRVIKLVLQPNRNRYLKDLYRARDEGGYEERDSRFSALVSALRDMFRTLLLFVIIEQLPSRPAQSAGHLTRNPNSGS